MKSYREMSKDELMYEVQRLRYDIKDLMKIIKEIELKCNFIKLDYNGGIKRQS